MFDKALEEHRETMGNSFRHMVFPEGVDLKTTFEEDAYFQDATFRNVSFWGTKFKGEADFTDAVFEGRANLTGTRFKWAADFRRVEFGEVTFEAATFEDEAIFEDASSAGKATFNDVEFTKEATFKLAQFSKEANFKGAKFRKAAYFWSVWFGGEVCFKNAKSKGLAAFDIAKFDKVANFRKVTFKEAAFGQAEFKTTADFRHATFEERGDFTEASFQKALFDHCHVVGKLTFAGKSEIERIFEGHTVSFSAVVQEPDSQLLFRYADLSQCQFLRTNLRRIDFEGVKWCEEVAENEWFIRVGVYDEIYGEGQKNTEESETQAKQGRRWYEIERLYRQLKKNYEERGDYPRAGGFHIGEKEARLKNPQTTKGVRRLLRLYKWSSMYGERPLPALGWLLSVVLVCATAYFFLGIPSESPDAFWLVDFSRAFTYSFRVSLLAEGIGGLKSPIGEWIQLLQSIFSPIMIALFALALRQRVKR